MFTLHAIVFKYLSKRRGRFYVVSIDFEKAFDNTRISHKKRFGSLSRKGVNGKFLINLLKIYKENCSWIKVTNTCTSYFPCRRRTRQGDTCSPQIFNLFIDDLCKNNNFNSENGIFITSNIPEITYLLFADDVASPADTVVRLHRQIENVENFCKETGMQFNVKKTQIVVCRRKTTEK